MFGDNLLIRLTDKVTLAGIKEYFERLKSRIDDEQLTQIFLPGRGDEFFYSDEDAGIVIDKKEQNYIPKNYRLPLPV